MNTLYIIFVIILGAIMGSFYACMGYRIPNKISLVKPNSFCDNCKKELKWYMNIPLFSYIFLKGKCAYCKSKIEVLGFVVEVLTSLLFLLFYLKYGFSTMSIIGFILTSVLAVTIISDIKYYYISDRVIVISIICLLLTLYFCYPFKLFLYYVFSGVFMFLVFLFIKLFGDKIFKKESLGGGDIKLALVIGLSLGVYPSMISLLIASVVALIYSFIILKNKKDALIPFGPFLIGGAVIVLYFISFFKNL